MNNRGFTAAEVLISLSLSFVIIYSMISIPVALTRDYRNLSHHVEVVNSINSISRAINSDLIAGNTAIIDENTLTIGDNIYSFSSDGVKRNNVLMTELIFGIEENGDFFSLLIKDKQINFNLSYY